MIQEILNNIVKHSEAQHISMRLYNDGKMFTLVITDDGVGFDVSEKVNSGGFGLLNLRNRAKLISAKLSIESSPLSGTIVMIEMPNNA